MIAALESSKHIHLGMLHALWRDNDPNRLARLLHGFLMLSDMDKTEPDAYAEMEFLRDVVAEMEKPL